MERYFPIGDIHQFGWSKVTQLSTECADDSSGTDLANQKQSIKSSIHMQTYPELALHEIPKVECTAQKHPKKKWASNEPTHPNPENSLTHRIGAWREKSEKKSLIEDMKEEATKKGWIHEVAVSDSQKKYQIAAGYLSKIKRCSGALEVMQKVGTSPDVTIEVIQDLIVDTIIDVIQGSPFLYNYIFFYQRICSFEIIFVEEFNI